MQDLRLAIRALGATPVVSTVAVLSLALGIGANTAIFSLVNGLLLRPLPVTEPHRLAYDLDGQGDQARFNAGLGWSYAMWDQFGSSGRTRLVVRTARSRGPRNASTWRRAARRSPSTASSPAASFFTTLGVPALLGRTFTAADDVRGGGPDGPVAVISDGLWRRRFGGAVRHRRHAARRRTACRSRSSA